MERENMDVVFVFYKKNTQNVNDFTIVKVLNFTDFKRYGDELLKDGWVHTSTVDPCRCIEGFCNNDVIGRSIIISDLINN